MTESVLDIRKYEGKRYLPPQRLVPFPTGRTVAPGTVALCYTALPTGQSQSLEITLLLLVPCV